VSDELRQDREIAVPLSRDAMTIDALNDENIAPCTVRDVARLAGVSTATVSRVMNGASIVSEKARTKVLKAISKLQYSPNAHAAELGKAGRGISKGSSAHGDSAPFPNARKSFRSMGQPRSLEIADPRVRRPIAEEPFELETLRMFAK